MRKLVELGIPIAGAKNLGFCVNYFPNALDGQCSPKSDYLVPDCVV
jgi:hypothetical protein